VKRFDFVTAPTEPHTDAPEGFAAETGHLDEAIGAEHLRGQVIEVAVGGKAYPYHWEAGKEEWLLVVSGTPAIRTPEGEQELRRGDIVCFPAGPAGAHQVLNRSDRVARVVIFSDATTPNVVVYPDSGKVGVRAEDARFNFLASEAVPYWTGE
jgi:uncharacterized cupin superfamily protein